METKSVILDTRTMAVANSNAWWAMATGFTLSPEWKFKDNNEAHTTSATYGMSIVAHGCLDSDGEYILSLGHSTYSGVGVFKVANDGTISTIYQDQYPRAAYTTYNSFAVRKDATKKMIFAGNYVYDEIFEYDFGTSWENTPTKTQKTQASDNLPEDETGDSYHTGLCVAGPYLYISPEPTSSATQFRWNIDTETADNITVINKVSNANDGRMWYDSVNDRVYQQSQIDGDVWVTINPQNATNHATLPAKTYNINTDGVLSFGNDAYMMGVVPDNTNPNHLWIMAYYGRIAKLDITDILAETATIPTVEYVNTRVQETQSNSFPFGGGYLALESHPIDGSDLPIICPDRGWCGGFGWFDVQNGLPVTHRKVTGDYDWGALNENRQVYGLDLTFDYAPTPVITTSANDTDYLVIGGYGQDGGVLRTYTADKAYLETSANIEFGNFQLPSTDDIVAVQIYNFKQHVYIPTGCTFAVHVSNNGGTNWETYSYNDEDIHEFTTTGDTLRIKMLMTGTGKTSSYVFSQNYPIITMFADSIDFTISDPGTPAKNGIKGL